MKKIKIFVFLLTLVLLQGVTLSQQSEESSFNPSYYTLNSKIKTGDSLLMKIDEAQTEFPNGTIVHSVAIWSNFYPENGTLNMTLVKIGSYNVLYNDAIRNNNGSLVSYTSQNDSFDRLYTGQVPMIITTNDTLLNSVKFSNITLSVVTISGNKSRTYNETIGNFTTKITNDQVIINGIRDSTGNSFTKFQYIFDKESGWLKEYHEYDLKRQETNFIYNSTLDLVTVAVTSSAKINSLSTTDTSSITATITTSDFFFHQMLVSLVVMSLFVMKKKKLI